MNLNTEPALHDITALRGNTAPNNVETHQIVNLEPEHLRHSRYASGYELIIPVVCGRGLASPISLKTASVLLALTTKPTTLRKWNMLIRIRCNQTHRILAMLCICLHTTLEHSLEALTTSNFIWVSNYTTILMQNIGSFNLTQNGN